MRSSAEFLAPIVRYLPTSLWAHFVPVDIVARGVDLEIPERATQGTGRATKEGGGVLPPPKSKSWGDAAGGTQEEFLETRTPAYLTAEGCKPFRWGFCVRDVSEDATAENAKWVSSLISWVQDWTGIAVLTNALCFKFTFYLHRYRVTIDPNDDEGETLWLRISPKLPIEPAKWGGSLPPHPFPERQGYRRVWVYETGDFVLGVPGRPELVVYNPEDGRCPDGCWYVCAQAVDIKQAFRADGLDVSHLGKAQCKNGRWSITSRAKAMEHYD